MDNSIIVVKQLPVIEERLKEIKLAVLKKAEDALALVCMEETLKEVKQTRAELNKEFALLEEKRKQAKQAVMAPYTEFEEVYKDCVSNTYKDVDNKLKEKINNVENGLKEQKRQELLEYFNEYVYAVESTLPTPLNSFLELENAGINITLSASMKSLKEQVKGFIDRVCDDIRLIDTQEHKDEILYHYKMAGGGSFLNASRTIQLVNDKYKAIAKAKIEEEERKKQVEVAEKAEQKVEEALKPPTETEEVFTVQLRVKGTKRQLKALKEFLNSGGYDYE